MPQIQVIAPLRAREPAKLRVCAYARVSSDSADQLNSFASQVRYYTNLIAGNEDWTLVDIYADRGITGTSTAKRTEFQRMMEDCRKGKIDRILVKSLSRFARNTQDCIAALRELRQLGVTVVFEKEHINTGTMANEMLISMMSAFAQEESVSISKNMRKGAVMRMQNGTFRISMPPYGYRYDASGDSRHRAIRSGHRAGNLCGVSERHQSSENRRGHADARRAETPGRVQVEQTRYPVHPDE